MFGFVRAEATVISRKPRNEKLPNFYTSCTIATDFGLLHFFTVCVKRKHVRLIVFVCLSACFNFRTAGWNMTKLDTHVVSLEATSGTRF
jgi:hypothetical protein